MSRAEVAAINSISSNTFTVAANEFGNVCLSRRASLEMLGLEVPSEEEQLEEPTLVSNLLQVNVSYPDLSIHARNGRNVQKSSPKVIILLECRCLQRLQTGKQRLIQRRPQLDCTVRPQLLPERLADHKVSRFIFSSVISVDHLPPSHNQGTCGSCWAFAAGSVW
jgi:C1A family cysteine protease